MCQWCGGGLGKLSLEACNITTELACELIAIGYDIAVKFFDRGSCNLVDGSVEISLQRRSWRINGHLMMF